jgi:hypothetical protein
MAKNTAELDATRFRRMVLEMSKHARITPEQVIDFEAGKMIESALKFTKVAKSGDIRKRVTDQIFNRPFRTLNGKIYFLGNRYPDAIWSKLKSSQQKEVSEKLKVLLKRRGLAKQSWWLLGKKLGIEIKAPAFAQKAEVAGADLPGNVRFRREGTGKKSILTLVNDSPSATSKGGKGHDAMRKAFRGRLKFFERNMKEGVFQNIKTIAAKYPGITVKP